MHAWLLPVMTVRAGSWCDGLTPEGFRHMPDFLARFEYRVLLNQLRALHFDHDVFHGYRIERGSVGFDYSHDHPLRALPCPLR